MHIAFRVGPMSALCRVQLPVQIGLATSKFHVISVAIANVGVLAASFCGALRPLYKAMHPRVMSAGVVVSCE